MVGWGTMMSSAPIKMAEALHWLTAKHMKILRWVSPDKGEVLDVVRRTCAEEEEFVSEEAGSKI
jgi:hypothetical protein